MKKKIAYCLPSLYIAGGIERVLSLKANYLAAHPDYEIYLILTDGKDKKPWYPLSPEVQIRHLDINFDELWHLPLWKKIIVYTRKQRIYRKRLAACLEEIRPDITVSMMRREINFLHRLKDGSKKIGEIHTNRKNFRSFEPDANRIKKWIQTYWTRQLIKKIKTLERFIVLTEEDKVQYPELDNIVAIPNPLTFYPDHCSDCNSRQIIAMGRYSHEKGFDLLLQAWKEVEARHPDYVLNIFGAGDRAPYEKLKKELHLKNCRLHEATNQVAEKYMESSISVLSSRFEGFGLVLTESMACGVPPVAFACPCGPRDIIRHGSNGLLTDNGNTDQLAEHICYLIEHPEIRRQMGKQARLDAQKYKLENIMKQWEELFQKL